MIDNLTIKALQEINEKFNPDYKIYGQTNEDLDALFENFDFNNKEVLSVLGSSDQLLCSYFYGAKQVDTFDRNITAAYYYYFRKWLINYTNEIYPFFYSYLNKYKEMVNNINPSNDIEQEAKRFWKLVLNNGFKEYDYFEYSAYCQRNKFEKDENFIKDIYKKEMVFKNFNMFEPINLNKKYDIIIVSNMIEYLERNKQNLIIIRNNLEKLLKDNGIVICSFIVNDTKSKNFLYQKEILTQNKLEYQTHYEYYEPLLGRTNESGYSYKLKKN